MSTSANIFQESAGLLALASLPKISARSAREIAAAGVALESNLERAFEAALDGARALVSAHEVAGISIITCFDERYPPSLLDLRSSPNVLFARGDISLLRDLRSVAVVGTRDPSAFGISATAAIVSAFAGADFITVSGLARGIDHACALTSLEANTPTVAVLGSGLDEITPTSHRGLAEEIVEAGGLLLSELPLGTPVRGWQLVARNRLQSGLACALIVGQTPIKSGTMHTVRFAAEQRRPIFCAQPLAAHPASAGNTVLLETPGTSLPEIAPAFASTSASWRQQYLQPQPLARPITRENLEAVVEELVRRCNI